MVWFLIFVAVVIFWAVSTFNRLILLRNAVRAAWSNIDVQLRRRYELIPNVVETVRAYARHEWGLLERIVRLRSLYLRGRSPEEKIRADREMTRALRTLFVYAESYPNLKASRNFLSLQSELSGTEDKLALSREEYNRIVLAYNTAREIFPDSAVADWFDFNRSEFFRVPACETLPVRVKFN
ncbi:MAG: hypothetical protein A2Z34_00645 [Planctomycetes bacterium RBG_16_59_8]|nr:MAG: hypothetical protein A2Z34_00645 [Planctomycetes bacterium RBG_16_59_8]